MDITGHVDLASNTEEVGQNDNVVGDTKARPASKIGLEGHGRADGVGSAALGKGSAAVADTPLLADHPQVGLLDHVHDVLDAPQAAELCVEGGDDHHRRHAVGTVAAVVGLELSLHLEHLVVALSVPERRQREVLEDVVAPEAVDVDPLGRPPLQLVQRLCLVCHRCAMAVYVFCLAIVRPPVVVAPDVPALLVSIFPGPSSFMSPENRASSRCTGAEDIHVSLSFFLLCRFFMFPTILRKAVEMGDEQVEKKGEGTRE